MGTIWHIMIRCMNKNKVDYMAECARESAKRAIGGLADEKKKEWFTKLFNILAEGKYARIKFNKLYPKYFWREQHVHNPIIDVQAIACTSNFASFFDIFNNDHFVDFEVMPVVTEELEYTLC